VYYADAPLDFSSTRDSDSLASEISNGLDTESVQSINPPLLEFQEVNPNYPYYCKPCSSGSDCKPGGACIQIFSTGEEFCTSYCNKSSDCMGSFSCLRLFPNGYCIPPNGLRPCEDMINDEHKPGDIEFDTDLGQSGDTLEQIIEHYPLCQPCGVNTFYLCPGESLCANNNDTGEFFCVSPCEHCPTGFSCDAFAGGKFCLPDNSGESCVSNFKPSGESHEKSND